MRKFLISATIALATTGAAASASALEFKSTSLLHSLQPTKQPVVRGEVQAADAKLEQRTKAAPQKPSDNSADLDDRTSSEDTDTTQPPDSNDEAPRQSSSHIGGQQDAPAAPV